MSGGKTGEQVKLFRKDEGGRETERGRENIKKTQ